MKKLITLLSVLFLAGSANAADYMVELKMSYFKPSKQVFKDVYGEGAMYGIKAEKSLYKKFGLIVESGYFKKRGKLTFTKENTTVKIFFLGPGIIYKHSKGIFDLYAGAGFRYYHFEEKNPIGHAKKGSFGYFVSLGTYINITKKLLFDFEINYSGCKIKPVDLKVEIGGLEAGIGIAYKF